MENSGTGHSSISSGLPSTPLAVLHHPTVAALLLQQRHPLHPGHTPSYKPRRRPASTTLDASKLHAMRQRQRLGPLPLPPPQQQQFQRRDGVLCADLIGPNSIAAATSSRPASLAGSFTGSFYVSEESALCLSDGWGCHPLPPLPPASIVPVPVQQHALRVPPPTGVASSYGGDIRGFVSSSEGGGGSCGSGGNGTSFSTSGGFDSPTCRDHGRLLHVAAGVAAPRSQPGGESECSGVFDSY